MLIEQILRLSPDGSPGRACTQFTEAECPIKIKAKRLPKYVHVYVYPDPKQQHNYECCRAEVINQFETVQIFVETGNRFLRA